MGFFEILTLILVVCKLAGIGAIAHWSWLLVFMPMIGFYGFVLFIVILTVLINQL
jgi:hypothetical protein